VAGTIMVYIGARYSLLKVSLDSLLKVSLDSLLKVSLETDSSSFIFDESLQR
jgi:hypothetical protein